MGHRSYSGFLFLIDAKMPKVCGFVKLIISSGRFLHPFAPSFKKPSAIPSDIGYGSSEFLEQRVSRLLQYVATQGFVI